MEMSRERDAGNLLRVVSVRLVDDPPLFSPRKIETPEDAAEVVRSEIASYDREVCCILNLQTDGRIINLNIGSIGAINQAFAIPRELLKATILSNAANIILMHNHPSGSCDPSQADIDTTRRFYECGQLLGIPLLDSIIVGPRGGYFSMKEHDLFPQEKKPVAVAEKTAVYQSGRVR